MKIKVNVLKTDLLKGTRASYSSCPIARAVRRTVGQEYHSVHIGTQLTILTPKGGPAVLFGNPRKVERFIRNFDQGKTPKSAFRPFSFTLNAEAQ